MISDQRYGYIASILKQGVVRELYDKHRLNRSDRIDKILINRLAGPIIMLLILAGLYHVTFTYSKTPVELCNSFFAWLGVIASENISNSIVRSLVVSGIINGVGGILGFIPLIMFMFLGIAVIEAALTASEVELDASENRAGLQQVVEAAEGRLFG